MLLNIEQLASKFLSVLYTHLTSIANRIHILIKITDGCILPPNLPELNGVLFLNITPEAITELFIEETGISFKARFNTKPFDVYIPIKDVMAITSEEVGVTFPYPFVNILIKPNQDTIVQPATKYVEQSKANVEIPQPVTKSKITRWKPEVIQGGKQD
jgi:stringent starvation protein B